MKLRHISLFFPFVFFLVDTTEGFIQHEKYKGDFNSYNSQGRYIVEFNEIESNQPSFASKIKSSYDKEVTIGQTFNHRYFKGMTFNFNDPNPANYKKTFKELLDHHQVKRVYPIEKVSRPEFKPTVMSDVKPGNVRALSPHHLTQVDRVHNELKYTGEGTTVCIIDTGVDYNHPALGKGFGPGHTVILGEDLVGDDYDGNNQPNVKPGQPPLDNCGKESGSGGHGTHVSGIIAGLSDSYVGVAPKAKLGMYRVFGCKGSSSSDIIISALLKASEADCHVINLSLGVTNSWTTGLQADVVTRIVNSGKHVVAAAGNDGSWGAFTISSPSSSKGAMSIASFNNENQIVHTANVTGAPFSVLYFGTQSKNFTNGEIVIGTNNLNGDDQACQESDISSQVKGKYALVKRGTCAYGLKAYNAQKAGAIGIFIYNSQEDDPFDTGLSPIPSFGISKSQGLALIEAIQKGKVEIIFSGGDNGIPAKLSGAKTVSSFSGIGATYDLELHPHVGGIGGYVYSTLPIDLGSWGTLSGTSMAAPYISGCVALFLNAYGQKKVSSAFILKQFQHYAYKAPKLNGETNLDSPLRQGAGLIQLFDSIQQKVFARPGQLSFNDTSSEKDKTQTITITNRGNQLVKYQVVNNASLSVQPYDLAKSGYAFLQPIGYGNDAATFSFSKNTIELRPLQAVNLTVTVKPPNTNPKEHIMYGGYIELKSMLPSALDLTIPYFGIVGKQKELPIFDTEKGYPYLSLESNGPDKETPKDGYVIKRNATGDTNATNFIYVNYRLLIGSADIQFHLLDALNKTIIGDALLPLNNTRRHLLKGDPSQIYNTILWDGTYYPNPTILDPVPTPMGTYVIQMKALRQFGDLNVDNDYEKWISPPIKIVN